MRILILEQDDGLLKKFFSSPSIFGILTCICKQKVKHLIFSEGVLTKEEAEAYLADLNDVEPDETMLKKAAGDGYPGDKVCDFT